MAFRRNKRGYGKKTHTRGKYSKRKKGYRKVSRGYTASRGGIRM